MWNRHRTLHSDRPASPSHDSFDARKRNFSLVCTPRRDWSDRASRFGMRGERKFGPKDDVIHPQSPYWFRPQLNQITLLLWQRTIRTLKSEPRPFSRFPAGGNRERNRTFLVHTKIDPLSLSLVLWLSHGFFCQNFLGKSMMNLARKTSRGNRSLIPRDDPLTLPGYPFFSFPPLNLW